MTSFVIGWGKAILLIVAVGALMTLMAFMDPAWNQPGHRELAVVFTIIMVVAIRVLVLPEMARATRSVTQDLLVQVRASDVWERAVTDRLDKIGDQVASVREGLARLEAKDDAELRRVRRHLSSMPQGLRMPLDE